MSLANNNITGMRHPGQRPTLSKGKTNGYATYEHWQQCITDYAIWQSRYASKYKDDRLYIEFLGRIYGTGDSTYINKINTMLNEYIKGD